MPAHQSVCNPKPESRVLFPRAVVRFAKHSIISPPVMFLKQLVLLFSVIVIVASFIWQMSLGRCPVP